MTVRFISDTFTKHLFWLLSAALLLVAAGWWVYSAYQLHDVLTKQISLRAQVQSQQIAKMPSLIAAVESQDIPAVHSLIKTLEQVSDADFITVSNKQGIRMTHPVEERIGLPVTGGDIDDALLHGKSYLSYASGSLGPSVRYISPIVNGDQQIIGMIKVGYLLNTLEMLNSKRLAGLLMFGLFIIVVSIGVAVRFSTYVKKNMQHMEPWELKQTLVTQQGVLQATHEGLLAVNSDGRIYVANDSARKLLGIHRNILSTHIKDWVDDSAAFSLSGDDFLDKLVRINGQNCVMTRVTLPMSRTGEQGAVFSLRASEELQALSETLSQVGQYIESLRVTRHEYQNQLSILAGLLQLGQYEQALNVVLNQSRADQQVLDQLKSFDRFPQLSALLLAKLMKAKERQVELLLPNEDHWQELPRKLNQDQLCAVVGNLLDNSMDAVQGQSSGKIELEMWESSLEFGLSITNNGTEITKPLDELTAWGYTTKSNSAEHGIGLYLTQSIIEAANGHVELDSDAQETSFTLYFPKHEEPQC
ncbi:ATP-binding protein [Vibrio ziniensis]|uniref:histidine kinase n=1 Tax=Vibrio ziniensis TaxID=2711221 RepID=A0A6G7CNF6_9VIBR|nr:sensor histidine kinase [Vibrio ziniensis]QIH43604.1 sensor histidine kinase [Vibrio ziniensis]